MKTKFNTYKFGELNFKCYYKPAGNGYELGVTCYGKPIFVGNFIHAEEANTWWKKMNYEIKNFTKSYQYFYNATPTWYTKFFANKLYTTYYTWLDQCFNKYTKTYKKAFSKHQQAYKKFERSYQYKLAA